MHHQDVLGAMVKETKLSGLWQHLTMGEVWAGLLTGLLAVPGNLKLVFI